MSERVQRIQQMAVHVQDDSFAHGYTEGHNLFLAQKMTSISDELIASFIEEAMNSPLGRLSNAGFVTGWLAALMKQQAAQMQSVNNYTCKAEGSQQRKTEKRVPLNR